MAVRAKKDTSEADKASVPLAIRPATIKRFELQITGMTPLICHAWSFKAKAEMLGKQKKEVTGGKQVRDPHGDFVSSLYEMEPGQYGFPVTGIKQAVLSRAHKDRGVARAAVLGALWFNHEMIRVMAAVGSAVCDMPLVRIIAGEPQMREDMVRVGSGLNKTATLAYRSQFWPWTMKLSGRLNTDVITLDALATLLQESGMSCGLGEWRNERSGIFGAYRLSTAAEIKAWNLFREGKGPLPKPPHDEDAMLEAA